MSSTALQLAANQLPTATQKANFHLTVNRMLSVAHYHDETPNEFFDVTSKALKGCVSNYHLYKDQLTQVFDIRLNSRGTESYQSANGNGQCKQYRLKIPIRLSDFEFTDTKTHSDSIDFDTEQRTVEMAVDVLKRLTITTGEKKTSRPVKTIWQANHHLKQYIQATITTQYVADRINLNVDAKTYEKKNKELKIRGSVSSFMDTKVSYTQASAAFILNEIRQSNFFCSISPTNGRLNTSFTSLASCMTKYLRLDGERMKGLDICNSQFLIFAVLLKNCKSAGKMFKFLEKNGYMDSEILGKGQQFKALREVIEKLQNIVVKAKKSDDFNTFIIQCEGGTVYDDFAKAASITRQQAKAAFFHLLFGGGGETEYSKLFAQIYPSVIAIVNRFKSQIGYELFSVMLQKIESIYFVKIILPMCYAQNILCLTKHDSLFTTERNFKKMERIFNEVMTKNFNDKFTKKLEN